jgi:hypothetical protein
MSDERQERLSDSDIKRELERLGSDLKYPPTPDLAMRMRQRLEEEQADRFQHRSMAGKLRRGVALAAVAILLLSIIVGFSPNVRSAVADWLGLGGIVIIRDDSVPGGMAPVGAGLNLGERTTLERAQEYMGSGYQILVPTLSELGEPDAIYLGADPYRDVVTLVYEAGPILPPLSSETGTGLLLSEVPGDIESTYFLKGIPSATQLEEITVNGRRGYWISGKLHLLDPIGGEERLAGNTLLWEQDGWTLRLESSLGREEAQRIAESVR